MFRPPPTTPLFPYTTLFRSRRSSRSSCERLLREKTTRGADNGPTPCRTFPTAEDAARHRAATHRSRSWCVRRSEEHTSELQSRFDLVCRLLLEKKKIRLLKR